MPSWSALATVAAWRQHDWLAPASAWPCSSADANLPTGEFPARFPDLRRELRVRGRSAGIGPETALYDVRVGDDMHVLVGCGLGGGSLVNAGVALRPDPRVFADPVWPGQIASGRPARRRLSPRHALAATCPRSRSLHQAQVRRPRHRQPQPGRNAGPRANRRQLRGQHQSCRHSPARMYRLRRLLCGLQCRRQEHGCVDIPARGRAQRRSDFHRAQSHSRRKSRRRHLARPPRSPLQQQRQIRAARR